MNVEFVDVFWMFRGQLNSKLGTVKLYFLRERGSEPGDILSLCSS